MVRVFTLFALCACAAPPSQPRAVRVDQAPADPGVYDLGRLPTAYGRVRWPEQPRIVRDVHGTEATDGTRLIVERDVDRLTIRASDVEVVNRARIGQLVLQRGVRRVAIRGGRYGSIELPVPAVFDPPPVRYDDAFFVSDITIDGVEIDSDDTALFVRGRRVAIVNSRARAQRYSVWCGDTGELRSQDIVIAGNHFDSAGPESTVRLVDVERAVVVDNVLSNTEKHDFRVHGASDRIVFARNRLLNTGIMIGSMEGDRIGSAWLIDNALYHTAPSLLEAPPERIARLVASGNRVYSDRWECFVCARGRRWAIGDNPVARYRQPPSDLL
jgi:hypothetical protein